MLSLSTLRACTQWFPLKLASFGWSIILVGCTSQKGLGRNREIDLFPSPHHQTIPPLPLTSGLWPHHVLYWLGTGWWCLGLTRASLSDLSKSLPAAHASAVTWRLSICVSWPFMWAFLWFFAPFRSWALYDNGLHISLAHFWFSLLPATLNCYSCRNNLILLDLQPAVYPFSQWPIVGTVLLLLMGSYVSLGFSFGHPWSDCFPWASSAHLLIPHSYGLFTNFIGLPRPNNLILIFGVHGPAINSLLS